MREVTDGDRAIGQRIRTARLRQKVALKSISAMLNVSVQQMQKYENGLNRISASRAVLVSEYLNISVIDLLGIGELPDESSLYSAQAKQLAAACDQLPENEAKQRLFAFVLAFADGRA